MHVFALLRGMSALYMVIIGIYRLRFAKIAHIPGPKRAALTIWYEFFFDVFMKSRYEWEIEKMHLKYGASIQPFH